MCSRDVFRVAIVVGLIAVTWCAEVRPGVAQEPTIMVDGQALTPEQAKQLMRARRGRRGPRPNVQMAQPQPEAKPEEKKEEPKQEKPQEDDSLKRPEDSAAMPDPRELEIELDDKGRVPPFTFVGHAWPDVLQWLANLTTQSLDWQELPKDKLNLSTQRSLLPDQVRDLINRHLQARGYTLLVDDGVMSAFKIDKLDPSLIPRIAEDELYDRQPHDFIKLTIALPDDADVAKSVEDIKQMLSPHAKVFPLAATGRVLLIATVANVRLVNQVLNEERLESLRLDNLREFPLRHARAERVIDILYVALGMDPNSQPTQAELMMKQQEMQMMMQLQQQGKDVSKMLQDDQPDVHLVYNSRRNSIIANAPPAIMRMIAHTIEYLDVPPYGASEHSPSDLAGHARTLKKYKLVTMEPESLQRMLEEIGELHPLTELRADGSTKMLFARATKSDHDIISGMIDELDGTGRQFEIISLRYKPADVVAAGIYNLMVGEEEKEEEDSVPWWRRYGYQEEEPEKPNAGFRVYADIESNSLWLWANDAELEAVYGFLEKMGEMPGEQATQQAGVRTYDALDATTTRQLLDQLKKAWSGENPLIVVTPDEEAADENSSADGADQPTQDAEEDKSARAETPPAVMRFVQQTTGTSDAESPPPIKVALTEDGRLVLSSADPRALDEMEKLIESLVPETDRFKSYPLQYIPASEMVFICNDLFKEEMEEGEQRTMLDWWGNTVDVDRKQKNFKLNRRAKLKFDWEPRANALMVANATPRQLRDVEKLIEVYDQPISDRLIRSRRTEPIKIRYSRASVIAEAVKDTYRDLLSKTDKEFESGDEKKQTFSSEKLAIIHYGDKKTEQVPARFDGALAIGVDDIANVLIVSATDKIFDSVVSLVKHLDEEARPRTTVAVHRTQGIVSAEHLQEVLSEALGRPWPGGRPEGAQPQAGGNEEQRRPDRRRDRDRRRRSED